MARATDADTHKAIDKVYAVCNEAVPPMMLPNICFLPHAVKVVLERQCLKPPSDGRIRKLADDERHTEQRQASKRGKTAKVRGLEGFTLEGFKVSYSRET